MSSAETRTTEWGSKITAALIRDFIQTSIRHDALRDFINEYIVREVEHGDENPVETAAALRVALDEILETAKPEDWEEVARRLISDTEDELSAPTASPEPTQERSPVGEDFLPVARSAKTRARRATAARIIAAAEELAAEQPGKKLSLLAIHPRAGVSLGTIFQRFGDKPGLMAAMRAQRVLSIKSLWADKAPEGVSALDAILAAAEDYLSLALTDPAAFEAITAPRDPGAATDCQEMTEAVAGRIAEQNAQVARLIGQGIMDGSLPRTDPEATAVLLWASWNGIISLGSRPDALQVSRAGLHGQLADATRTILGVK